MHIIMLLVRILLESSEYRRFLLEFAEIAEQLVAFPQRCPQGKRIHIKSPRTNCFPDLELVSAVTFVGETTRNIAKAFRFQEL